MITNRNLRNISNFISFNQIFDRPKYKHYPEKIKDYIKSRLRNNIYDNETHFSSSYFDNGFDWNSFDSEIMDKLDFEKIQNPVSSVIIYGNNKNIKMTVTNLETRQDFVYLDALREEIEEYSSESFTYGMMPDWIQKLIKEEVSLVSNIYDPKTNIAASNNGGGFYFSDSKYGGYFWSLISDLRIKEAFKELYKTDYIITYVKDYLRHVDESEILYNIFEYDVINYNNAWKVKLEIPTVIRTK